MKGIKVLSLFDGISCGKVALERAGIHIEEYVAFEIDKSDVFRLAEEITLKSFSAAT